MKTLICTINFHNCVLTKMWYESILNNNLLSNCDILVVNNTSIGGLTKINRLDLMDKKYDFDNDCIIDYCSPEGHGNHNHMYCIQYILDKYKNKYDDMILMDNDTTIKENKNIMDIIDTNYCSCGKIEMRKIGDLYIPRISPRFLYINLRYIRRRNIKFIKSKEYKLDLYLTGMYFLQQICDDSPYAFKCFHTDSYINHMKSGSGKFLREYEI